MALLTIVSMFLVFYVIIRERNVLESMTEEERAKYIKNGYQTDRQIRNGKYMLVVVSIIVVAGGWYFI